MMIFNMSEKGFETTTSFGTLEISGQDEYGFRPYQLLVSSIAACSGGSLRNVLEKMRMPATHLTIEVKEVLRNTEEANRLEKVHLHFIIEGDINKAKMERAMALAHKNCSMVQSVNENIEIIETYSLKS